MLVIIAFSNFLFVVFSLLGDSHTSEFYVQTFRNTLFHLHWLCKHFFLLTQPMKMEETEHSETSAYKIHTSGNHPKENTTFSTR